MFSCRSNFSTITSQDVLEGEDDVYSEDAEVRSFLRDLDLHLTSKDNDDMVTLMKRWKNRYIDGRPVNERRRLSDVDWKAVHADISVNGMEMVSKNLVDFYPVNQQVRYKPPSGKYLTEHARGVLNKDLRDKGYRPSEEYGKFEDTSLTDFKMGKPAKKSNKEKEIVVVDGEPYEKLAKFSFWERKHKGWYPADSKLPDEFPTIVRGVAFEILSKNHNYITPDDDAQLVKLTSDICAELDKIWKPEWGVRPSGHYLQADVKDAWEDLD